MNQLVTTSKTGLLQISKIEVDPEYKAKWNERSNDFVCLTKGGELLRPTLYRIGGINFPKPATDRYFMLLKYVEAQYSADIMRMSKSKNANHLEGRWCIIDSNGDEKVEASCFKHPYIVSDSCIYSLDSNYYNIENGYFYCNTSTSMDSKDFLFLDNRFDKDQSRRGVFKINKQDGSYEIFPGNVR